VAHAFDFALAQAELGGQDPRFPTLHTFLWAQVLVVVIRHPGREAGTQCQGRYLAAPASA